jgi:hypothetical protein
LTISITGALLDPTNGSRELVNQNPNFGGALALACGCMLLVLVVVLAIYIFFCLTLMRTQSEVHPRNRLIPAGLVWLHLLHLGGSIPILGIVVSIGASVWDLIMVIKLAGSLKLEFEDRGWGTEGEGFGRTVGLIWSIGQLAGLPLGLVFNLLGPQQVKDPAIAFGIVGVVLVFALTLLVCWIIYWVQMAGYGRRLREDRGVYGRGGVEEDYDDEFRPRRLPEDDEFEDDRRERRRDDDFDDRNRPDRGRRLPEDDEFDDEPPRKRDEF